MKIKSAPYALDVFHYHEAQDRLYNIIQTIHYQISEHPVFIGDVHLNDKLKCVEELMVDIFNEVSAREELLK